MKTSGFREIDFSKTECKNCAYFVEYYGYLDRGKIMTHDNRAVDCPICKGTGYIDESSEIELELE